MIKIFTDSAFEPDTLETGLGVNYMHDRKQTLLQHYVSACTSVHQGEFLAVFFALKYLEQTDLPKALLWIHTDSQVVVHSLEKHHVKDPDLKELLDEILKLLSKYSMYFVKWIPGSQNQQADQLAKNALRLKKNH